MSDRAEQLEAAPPEVAEAPKPPAEEKRSILSFVFKVLLAAGILTWLVVSGRLDFSHLGALATNWPGMALAFAIILPSLVIPAVRHRLILQEFDLHCSFRDVFRWTMIGSFFDLAMPTASGGDFIKAVYIARAFGEGRRSLAVLSVLLDRVMGLIGLFYFALIMCLFGFNTISADPKLRLIPWILAAICFLTLLGFTVATSRYVRNHSLRATIMSYFPESHRARIEGLYGGLCSLHEDPRVLIEVLVLSILNHAINCVALLMLAKAMNLNINPLTASIVMPIGLFLNTFGVAGGFGAGEAAFAYLFEKFLGSGPRVGAIMMLVYHCMMLLMKLGGLPFYLMKDNKKYSSQDSKNVPL